MKLHAFVVAIMLSTFWPSFCRVSLADDFHSKTTLHHVLLYTLQNNPSYQAAKEELNKTQELYPQARAGWLPTLSAETSLYHSDIESSNFGTADGSTTKDVSLNLEQPIWRGGQTFAEADRAKDLIKAGHSVLKQKEQEILWEAITAYVNVFYNQKLLDLRRENERLLKEELKAAIERLEMGAITKTDVQQAKTRLSRAKSSKLQAENQLYESLAIFKQVVGVTAPLEMEAPLLHFDFPKTSEEIQAIAELQNPEILMMRSQKEAAKHNTEASFRKLFPQISAFASYNKQYDPQPGLVDDSSNKTFGVRAKILLFQGGTIRSQTRESEKEHRRLEYEESATIRRIKQSVSSSWFAYLSAKEQTTHRINEIETAKMALEGVKIEAREGQRSILDILDADQEVINAQTSLINAHKNELLSKYFLAKTLGILSAKNINHNETISPN